MKVLYLFTGHRRPHLNKVLSGEEQGNGYWGMLRLGKFGVEARHLELEDVFPAGFSSFIRKHILSVYWVHLPLYPKFFAYDIVFTSTGYGTQLLHTLLNRKKPLWVMYDFSIMGLLGKEKTVFQKVFAWMVSRAGGIITLGIPEAEALKQRFPHLKEKIAWIPYGVDLEYFSPKALAQERMFFVPGRDPDRDYGTLFAAAEGLGARTIVTTHASRLEKCKPLPSFVEHATLSVEELRATYAKATAVVIPLNTKSGLNDAMGVSALYEALAMGKAIVATRTPTIASYITDGENGLLVDEGDVAGMHEALARIVNDENLRMRLERNARAYAEKYLDTDQCTKQLADFFTTLLNAQKTT